jgi:excisionase family DNA binding protein
MGSTRRLVIVLTRDKAVWSTKELAPGAAAPELAQEELRQLQIHNARIKLAGSRMHLTVKEASLITGLPAALVYRLVREGKLSAYKTGFGWRIFRDNLNRIPSILEVYKVFPPPDQEDYFKVSKHCTLEIFERCGWLNPVAWALLASDQPARAAYSYLLHLHRLGLLLRRHNTNGLLLYGLSKQGSRRLGWLRAMQRTSAERGESGAIETS